jgi:hypothetical protein
MVSILEPDRVSNPSGRHHILVTTSKITAFIYLKTFHYLENPAFKTRPPTHCKSEVHQSCCDWEHIYFPILHNVHDVTCADDK